MDTKATLKKVLEKVQSMTVEEYESLYEELYGKEEKQIDYKEAWYWLLETIDDLDPASTEASEVKLNLQLTIDEIKEKCKIINRQSEE